MGERYWLWVLVRLGVGVAIVAWAASYIGTGSGEKEFQKTVDALKQVHSFRVVATTDVQTQHSQMLWEVDCDRNILHHQMHLVVSNSETSQEVNQDELNVNGRSYQRDSSGSWSPSRYAYATATAKSYCANLSQGADSPLLPRFSTMIQRGILQKGDKKTVNGVRCREWLVAMRGAPPSGMEHDTVCLGVKDRFPYELTEGSAAMRTLFSDYNTPIQFDAPEAILQPASESSSSN